MFKPLKDLLTSSSAIVKKYAKVVIITAIFIPNAIAKERVEGENKYIDAPRNIVSIIAKEKYTKNTPI
jgi:hypothetical protein